MSEANIERRVTLLDIARRLGVSQATVSLALRNDPQISPPRRAEVAKLAGELGYRPDPMLSALNRYRHETRPAAGRIRAALAWLNRWRRPEALRELGEFDEYWRGATEMAEARGFHLEEIVWHEKLSAARLRRILTARGIRGVLIPPAERSAEAAADRAWTEFPWTDFSVVRLGRSIQAPGLPVVAADQVYNCRLAVAEMRRRGHGRVGFATTRRMTGFTLSLAGFLMAQTELPVSARIPPLVLADDEAGEELKTWLREAAPDAVVTDSSAVAGWLTEKGPGERSGGTPGLAALSMQDGGAKSGIDQRPREIGRTAVEVLITQLERHATGIPAVGRETLVQGRWVDGAAPEPGFPRQTGVGMLNPPTRATPGCRR